MSYMYSIMSFISWLLNAYVFVLFIYALLSWFPGGYQSTLGKFLIKICEPYLNQFRRLPLQVGPIDFTIIVAIIFLEMVNAGFDKLMFNLMMR